MFAAAPRIDSDLATVLQGVSPSAAKASCLFHDARLQPLWQAVHDGADAAWRPVAGPGPARRYDAMLESDFGSIEFGLASDDDAISAIAALNGGTSLQMLALEAVFERTLDQLTAFGLPGLRIARLAPCETRQVPDDAWTALWLDGREQCRVALRALPERMCEALRAARAPVRRQRPRTLRIAGAVAVAERQMRVSVLRSLERGDVVLLGLPGATPSIEGALATLRIDGGQRVLRARGRIDTTSFNLLGAPFMTDHDPARTPGGDLPATALDELEVPVHFELETVSIALSDLESIEPGYVIELATPASQARLRLVSCGIVIGEADLVAVAGQLGARITNLAAHHDADHQRG
jgi:type III secretion protein Q